MGFEVNKGDFEKLKKEYLDSFKNNGIIKNNNGEVVGHYYPKKEYKTDKNIKFIEVDYNTDNETKDILKAISNQKDYSTVFPARSNVSI